MWRSQDSRAGENEGNGVQNGTREIELKGAFGMDVDAAVVVLWEEALI